MRGTTRRPIGPRPALAIYEPWGQRRRGLSCQALAKATIEDHGHTAQPSEGGLTRFGDFDKMHAAVRVPAPVSGPLDSMASAAMSSSSNALLTARAANCSPNGGAAGRGTSPT
ncbi:MAG: hypothetical protein WKF47_01425 [Geodermatophilaceae bacterium]